MKISRAMILETALRRPFETNAAVRRMILDGLSEGGTEGLDKIVSAYKIGHASDLLSWSYLKDSQPGEIVEAARRVADRYQNLARPRPIADGNGDTPKS